MTINPSPPEGLLKFGKAQGVGVGKLERRWAQRADFWPCESLRIKMKGVEFVSIQQGSHRDWKLWKMKVVMEHAELAKSIDCEFVISHV